MEIVRRRWRLGLFVGLGSAAVLALGAAAAEKKIATSRPSLAQHSSKNLAARMAALRRVREMEPLDGAKFLVPRILSDPAPELRREAFETLLLWKDEPEAAEWLLKTLQKEIKAPSPGLLLPPLVGILIDSRAPGIRPQVDELLGSPGKNSRHGVWAVTTLASELGSQSHSRWLPLLRSLLASRCCQTDFACHRATVRALTQTPAAEAVDILIQHMEETRGEIRGDIIGYLSQVSGGNERGNDPQAWKRWWKEKQSTFEFPPNLNPLGPLGQNQGLPLLARAPAECSYYGLPIYAQRLVFAIDISSSMASNSRIEAAKRELAQAIGKLPNNSSFGIVVFNHRLAIWRRQLHPATEESRRSAIQFVENLRPEGSTATYDALSAALGFQDVEAIYLLSDGAPTAGRIVHPEAILAAITSANRTRQVSFYTIGISLGGEGSVPDSFMRYLAQQNFGVYRRVDGP